MAAMTTPSDAVRAAREANVKKGLVIVNTGHGKGKTTAALGTVLRAWGQGLRICVVQFIKAETGAWGEVQAAHKLGIEWHKLGDGFTWQSRDMDKSRARALVYITAASCARLCAEQKILHSLPRARGVERPESIKKERISDK